MNVRVILQEMKIIYLNAFLLRKTVLLKIIILLEKQSNVLYLKKVVSMKIKKYLEKNALIIVLSIVRKMETKIFVNAHIIFLMIMEYLIVLVMDKHAKIKVI